ncbi:pantetheine-phosphate adenylyltransferase [Actinomyces succiniciruminis]|uniref:Phosphopantetheine adenylyltransferase n=1 Tax=Actinomyces succiniciruminis TaxID=1522002 RepID=A0A1L7RJ89_9ACTO|nr:pantetheine-phosphate adenylyltransferase [Actinomyces succiniciruminis]CED91966.1 Phosphopantetheine adenylyltransferase [Actinomyces succiniciruminis]
MTLAVYPGTFDPITLGHVDVVRRAATLFDRVILGVAHNAAKDSSRLFTIDERVALARAALAHIPGAEVAVIPGLLADFCAQRGADAIVKGLRNGTDFDAEVPMALLNRELGAPETFFLAAAPTHAHVSSSLVKDVARHGGDVSALVPAGVAAALARAFATPAPGTASAPAPAATTAPAADPSTATPNPQNRRTNP